jgi:hypothetical protein
MHPHEKTAREGITELGRVQNIGRLIEQKLTNSMNDAWSVWAGDFEDEALGGHTDIIHKARRILKNFYYFPWEA